MAGTFKLHFRGQSTQPIAYGASQTVTAASIQTALINLDTISANGVVVTIPTQTGYNEVYFVSFTGLGMGGNVESIVVIASEQALTGSGAGVQVFADPTVPYVNPASVSFTPVRGAQITGSFTLSLLGHTTASIDYNSNEVTMASSLQSLPNVGTVTVKRSAKSEQYGYTWTVSFISSPGYFPVQSRIVPQMTPTFSTTLTTTNSATTTNVVVAATTPGFDPLSGTFKLSYSQVISGLQVNATTNSIDSFASAADVKAQLELLPNVGRVTVSKVVNVAGYSWFVTFSGCKNSAGVDIYNIGHLVTMKSVSSLVGCGVPTLAVTKSVSGSGPSACALQSDLLCHGTITDLSSGYPLSYGISGLATGTSYYVRVSAKNSESYGVRM